MGNEGSSHYRKDTNNIIADLTICTFIASYCTVPERYMKEIESCCFKLIWKGKPDQIKRSVLINTYEKGGLNMADIDSYFKSLKTSLVTRLTNTSLANWKVIPMKYFNNLGKIG